MKNRKGKRRQLRHRKLFGAFDKPSRPRRSWTFEQLEERCYFAVSPLTGLDGSQYYAVSNSTPEGQQLINDLQLLWAAQASGTSNPSGTNLAELYSIPTDPYFEDGLQWNLLNVGQVVNFEQFQKIFGVPGQDINVVPVWDQGITGQGVVVAVVDSGVQLSHPDLQPNITMGGWNGVTNRPGGGVAGDEPHGTAVAGLIGAVGNNGIGGAGVAYGATIFPIVLGWNNEPSSNPSVNSFISSITAGGADIDIFNHSWGPSFEIFGRNAAGPNMQELAALTNSVLFGRDGLGAIHVFASGNSSAALHSAGSNGFVNSRYTIGVGMVDHDGKRANSDGTSTNYGEVAPSVLIVAPSASGPTDIINNFDTGSGVFTTDMLGDSGYNVAPIGGIEIDIDRFPDTDYTTRFGGTSGAAPMVSGVVALMLEANPNLTWRDVQEILVRSARQNDDLDESWITNLVPLFRDPFAFTDQYQYRLVPATLLDPAVQASTGTVFAANTDFTITAVADTDWDGEMGNNLQVVFRAEPGDSAEVVAEIITPTELQPTFFFPFNIDPIGTIRITVTGNGVTWDDIQDAVSDLGGFDPMGNFVSFFDMQVSDPTALFDPTDEAIVAPLFGGMDATGFDSTLELYPQFQFYHPIDDPLANLEPLSLFTNGAGYTVSHGRGGTAEYGWAHGVVNAELAVELAKQWHIKNQNLPAEKTFLVGLTGVTTIRGARITNMESGEYVIPGGLSSSNADFAAYFNEFFKVPTIEAGDPMAMPNPIPDRIAPDSRPFGQQNPPFNSRGSFVTFNVPAVDPVSGGSNLMTMEWVEVRLNVTGDPDAMNNLRITLVSPDGTHSELTQNQYRPADIQHSFQSMATGGRLVDPAGSISEDNTFTWVYSTNRIWGERSDSRPIFDEFGNFVGEKDWELHFENYNPSSLGLSGVSVAFHGSPIGSTSDPIERIMGKVGVDSGRFIQQLGQIVGASDGEFNFDRYLIEQSFNSHANTTASFGGFSDTPYGMHEIRVANELQERFAGNITVYAIDNITGQRVAEFVTGYDGNYYFDLPNNDRQATTGVIAAQNSTVTVTATKNGGYNGALGNGVTVNFAIDPTVSNAAAQLDVLTDTILVRVRDESVTWNAIENAIESISQTVIINGVPLSINRFNVSVSNPLGTFSAADANIVGTLTGGIDGTYTIGIEDPLGRTTLDGRVAASTGVVAAQNATFNVSATQEGRFRGTPGNGITVNFDFDPTSTFADVFYDSFTRTIHVTAGPTVTWGEIKDAIEQISLTFDPDFSVTVSDANALFDAADDGLVATLTGGLQRNYDNEWVIRIDHTDDFTREAAEIDPVTGRLRYFNDVNFLLDPGAVLFDDVVFTGEVIADLDGDGARDPEEIGVSGFLVFADVNHSGLFELGEPFTHTDAEGNYELHVPTATPNTFSISVQPPAGWTITDPVSGFQDRFQQPGDEVTLNDFLIMPPSSPTGEGGGSIFGFVFNDWNGDSVRQPGAEPGLANFVVFIDAGGMNGQLDPGEISTTTNSTGAYKFENLAPGSYRIDVVVDLPYILTAPQIGFRNVTLAAGQVVQGVNFGVRNLATHDWGDLPENLPGRFYPTTAANNGPRHRVGNGFQLGAKIDSELDGQANSTATGDDITGIIGDDEDGVRILSNFGSLNLGTNIFEVTVLGVGGYLTGWIDWNSNGFDEGDRVVWRDVQGNILGGDVLLTAGTHTLHVVAPQNVVGDMLAARFRWGEAGLTFVGEADHGEVEDYFFNFTTNPVSGLAGDYNNNGKVDAADYVLWRKHLNTPQSLPNDPTQGNTPEDYAVWVQNFGAAVAGLGGGAAAANASASEFDSDSLADEVHLAAVEEAGPPLPVSTAGLVATGFVSHAVETSAMLSPLESAAAKWNGSSLSAAQLGPSLSDAGRSDADLLLLDRIWAERADHGEEESPILDRFTSGDESDQAELAFAAVFENETQWWSI